MSSRRFFLKSLASIAGASLLAGAAIADEPKVATPALDIKLAEHDDLKPVGGSTVVETADAGKVIIAHTAENAFTALSAKCMHKGCTVEYNADDKRFDCPCHGSQYALDGSVLHGPTQHPLRAFTVAVNAGVVTVSLAPAPEQK